MHRLARGTAIAAAVAAAMVVTVAGPAVAEEGPSSAPAAEVEATLEAITEATEAADARSFTEVVASEAADADSASVVETSSGTVDIPTSPDGTISVGDGSAAVEIGLPEVVSADGVLDQSGETVVYSDAQQPADVAVQATDGGARALVTIKDATAPDRYAFPVDGPEGSRLVPATEIMGADYDTGEVLLVAADGLTVLGTFDAPWATDANGAAVPTRYEIEGSTLVQVVEFGEDTAFPVVADPNWWSIAKCAAAITWFIGTNIVVVSKLIKIKKYIAALGGIRRSAELILRASTWEERLRIGGGALVGLASEILGFAAIRNNC